MRPADPLTLTRSNAPAGRIAWLLELTQGSWRWRGATQAATIAGEAWPARLGPVEQWLEELPMTALAGGRARGRATLGVPGGNGAESLRAELETRLPVGIAARLALAWLDDAATAEGAPALLTGRLTAWRIAPAGVVLTLTDTLDAIAGRRIGRLLSPAMLSGGTSPALGQPLPWIFGAVAGAALVPLRIGATTRLATAIDATAGVLAVESLAGFPASGFAQIRGETFFYPASDPVAMTLGTPARPIRRGTEEAACAAGEAVRERPWAGYTLLVADHPCRAVTTLEADGLRVDPATWESTPLLLGGQLAQIVRLNAWPPGEDGRPARRLTAQVEGLADAEGQLIENPARLLERLLTDPRLGALTAAQVDAASLTAAAAALDTRGARMARRVGGGQTLGSLIDGVALEAGLWVQATDPICVAAADAVPHARAAVGTLDATRLLAPAAPARLESPEGFLPPDAVELTGPAPRRAGERAALLFPPEAGAAGRLPRRFEVEWLDLEAGAAGGALGERLWRRLGEAPFFHRPATALGGALTACGDTVQVDDPPLGMERTLGWVRRVEAGVAAGGAGRARLEVWGPWAGAFAVLHDAQHWVRRFAFGGHLLWTVAGRPVALLTRGGTLRLAGRLRESAVFATPAMEGPLAFDGGWSYAATGLPGAWTAFLRIDGAGHAELRGTLRERQAATTDPGGAIVTSDAARCVLAPDGRTAALEYTVAAARLDLPGILIESVRF